MERISVIVPVYRVENDLKRCICSIQAQTHTNMEIILVDDGSPDQCGMICDEMAANDERIRVIHKRNGGLSSARNAGIEVATGQYLAFVDSDDWIDPAMLSVLYSLCVKKDAQIAECSYRSVFSNRIEEETRCSGRVEITTPIQAIKSNLLWGLFRPVAWNKLYSRSVIGDTRYPVGKIHEDEFTTHKYYLAANRIAYVDTSFYNYNRRREDSITASFKASNLDKCDAFLEKVQLIWSKPELQELDKIACDVYSFQLFSLLTNCVRNKIDDPRVDETVNKALLVSDELVCHGIEGVYVEAFDVLKNQGLTALEKHYRNVFEGGPGR